MVNNLKHFIGFIRDLYQSRSMILQLAKNDFRSRYIGSYLGITWAFIQPLVTILVMWFVFQVGFKATPVDDIPFILWLSCGLIPWFFFVDSVNSSANSLFEYSYLVKKVVFRVSVLPIIKIVSAFFVHLFFIAFLVIMFQFYGYRPTVYYFQLIYYSLCMLLLVTGLSWITSSLVVFLKDTTQVIAVILQMGFWLTPILWPISMVPEKYHFLFKLNPMFYIVYGYRDSLILGVGFWHRYNQSAYFWIMTLAFFLIGAFLFRRLRPHFPDLL